MKDYNLRDRILGSLVAAGIGDALGAPTEGMSYVEISHYYGGRVTTFVDGAVNPYFHNAEIGSTTDDTSQMYEMAKAVIRADGNFTAADAAEGLLLWADNYPDFYPTRTGPTAKLAIEEIKAGKDPVTVGKSRGTPERGSSNGAAMRVAAAGLAHPGDLAAALETAITMTKISHGTQIGYASAAAIACGIAAALVPHNDVYQVLKACMYGAREGDRRGRLEGRIVPGATVQSRIRRAIGIAYDCSDMEEAERRLDEAVGSDSSMAAPTVAVAIGLFAAAGGDTRKLLLSTTNVGGDTDTMGCIAGMLAGAYNGYDSLPADWRATFAKVNPQFDMEKLADGLVQLAGTSSAQ